MDPWNSASRLDRVGEHRGSLDWIASQWRHDEAKLLKVDEHGRCFVTDDQQLRMTRPFVEFDPERHFLLGTVDDVPIFTVAALPDGPMGSVREIVPQLGETDRDIAVTAVAMTHWHRLDRHCTSDGTPTVVIRGGLARRCPTCSAEYFPRTDPAVIVGIRDRADRLLLGHQSSWDAGRVSVLAGFVEVGESFEQAVHREIAEESAIELGELTYFGSQPWPFPRSVMVAFMARAETDDIDVDGKEIEWARWFTRAELRGAVDRGEVTMPARASIAWRMINDWLSSEPDPRPETPPAVSD